MRGLIVAGVLAGCPLALLGGCGGGGSKSTSSGPRPSPSSGVTIPTVPSSAGSPANFKTAYLQIDSQYHQLGLTLGTFFNNLAHRRLPTNVALVSALQPIDTQLKALNTQLARLHPPTSAAADFANLQAVFARIAGDMDALIGAAQANGTATTGRADTLRLIRDSYSEKSLANRLRADVGLPPRP
jgi:hypothetical protein